ncbi:MAG: MarR family transcriptional regulator [Rhodoblastus sp.]|jgi:DNA-binding MarR family transcriptional regulator
MGDTAVTAKASEAATEGSSSQAYDLDQQIGFLLRQAQQRHTAIFARMMLEEVTPTQWATLAKLHEIGGCSQNLLGRHVAMDAATIKGVVDRLLARGMIVTSADPSDSRRLTIDLSERGREFVERALPIALAITEETVAPLDQQERATLLALIAKIR